MCAYDAWGLLSSSYPTTVTMEHTCPYYSCYPQHLPNEALLGRYDCCACDASGRISFPTIIATLEHKQMPLPLPPPHLPMKLHSVRTAYKSYGTTCFFFFDNFLSSSAQTRRQHTFLLGKHEHNKRIKDDLQGNLLCCWWRCVLLCCEKKRSHASQSALTGSMLQPLFVHRHSPSNMHTDRYDVNDENWIVFYLRL